MSREHVAERFKDGRHAIERLRSTDAAFREVCENCNEVVLALANDAGNISEKSREQLTDLRHELEAEIHNLLGANPAKRK